MPTKTETSREVVKALMELIIPRYGLPMTVCSDNGPAFVGRVVQSLSAALSLKWKLHTAYSPQSSGQVERQNRTLKNTLSKLCQETGANWVTMLPMALLRSHCTPYRDGLTPFEIIFGRPPPLVPIPWGLQEIGALSLQQQLQALQKTLKGLQRTVLERHPFPLHSPRHAYEPGDRVLIKSWKEEPLREKGAGPYVVVMTSPCALKVAGYTPWVHHTHVKRWTAEPSPAPSPPSACVPRRSERLKKKTDPAQPRQ
ncbi:PREDICTED: uncharacterized protein LOC106147986 [Chinchilla lanigera]|uniref:uncharacterized protein LOC106147986 n=1 Tax=Chinchilla lanigera TaxID=34839 RepID=UPI000697DF3A|nr:PREDICTED: uncharacterized protein LOC106147986 [Chinchilla lanigera]